MVSVTETKIDEPATELALLPTLKKESIINHNGLQCTKFNIVGTSLTYDYKRPGLLSHPQHIVRTFDQVSIIARGTFSVVYKCVLTSGREIALKVTKKNSEKRSQMARGEIHRLSKIKWKNSTKHVVDILDSFETSAAVYGVLELLDLDLRAFLDTRGPLPFIAAKLIVKQICSAIIHLETLDIIHGDIKTRNIGIVPPCDPCNPRIKLMDFNSALSFETAKHGPLIQTLPYRAPEVVIGQQYDSRVDVYSLGTVLIELLIAKRLFPCRVDFEYLHQVENLLRFNTAMLSRGGCRRDEMFVASRKRWSNRLGKEHFKIRAVTEDELKIVPDPRLLSSIISLDSLTVDDFPIPVAGETITKTQVLQLVPLAKGMLNTEQLSRFTAQDVLNYLNSEER